MRTPETQRVYHNGDWVRINGLSQNLHGQVGQIVSEPIPDYKGHAYRVQLSYEAVLIAHGRNLEPVEQQAATVCPTCGREVAS